MAEVWIGVSEAAQLTGYHPEHLRRLIRQGKVKARKIVTVWQVEKASLLDYLRTMEAEQGDRGGPHKKEP